MISLTLDSIPIHDISNDFGTVICVNDEQDEKALSPICVTDNGIVIFVSDEQWKKTLFPICVTVYGIVISLSDEHQ